MGVNIRKIVVKYSGGLDSTLVADRLAREYDEVRLLTYIVPTQYGLERARINANILKTNFPGKIEHYIIDIREDINKIRGSFPRMIGDCFKYRFSKPFCVGCKAGMHMHSILYCLEHGINEIADGNNLAESSHAFEQRASSVKDFKNLYRKYGIRYFNPIYNLSKPRRLKGIQKVLDMFCLVDNRKDIKKELISKDYHLGKPIGDMHRSIQPQCWMNPFFGVAAVFFPNSQKGIKRYIRNKIRLIDRMIQDKQRQSKKDML